MEWGLTATGSKGQVLIAKEKKDFAGCARQLSLRARQATFYPNRFLPGPTFYGNTCAISLFVYVDGREREPPDFLKHAMGAEQSRDTNKTRQGW